MNRLEGVNCADLPGFVIDKYFDCNVKTEPLKAMVAQAICRQCVVLEECRDEALNQPSLQPRGVIGGVAALEIREARAWRQYELGITDQVPGSARPEWLTMPDAAQIVEQMRTELDPDVPAD